MVTNPRQSMSTERRHVEGSTSLARKSSFNKELLASVDTSREVSAVGSGIAATSEAVVGQATVANVQSSFESSSQQQHQHR